MQYRLSIDVFCHAEQTSASAKALGEQRAFARCKVAVRDGGLARAVTHDPKGPERCKFIAVMGARGGVGSSTIAHNMAWAAARRLNIKTILADMDLTFGTAGLAFNQDPRQSFGEAFADADRLDITLLERYMAGDDENLQILST